MTQPNNTRLLRRAILWIGSLLLLYAGSILVYGSIHDFQPPVRQQLEVVQNAVATTVPAKRLRFTIWNLGFAGLGKESDFFYDDGYFFFSGGKSTRTPLPLLEKNLNGIRTVIDSLESDFFLLQEIDRRARRSYQQDQVARLAAQMPSFATVFSTNFNVPYVPIPLLEPWHAYGQVFSGLATFSRFQPLESTRIQLPGNFGWPKRVFSLDRCLSVQRYPVENGKQLIVVNVHNSAYDRNGKIKYQQLELIRELLQAEYEAGNYVIAGGDWNMCPPYFRFDGYMPGQTQGYTQLNIPADLFPPDWLWLYDATFPTNRKTRDPFEAGKTFVTLIDFFLVSPNVKVQEVKTINLDFDFSDHQPVWMEVELL